MRVLPPIRRSASRAVFCLMLVAGAVPSTGQELTPSATSTDPVDQLSMHLRTLAVAPRSLSALLGAGEAAIAVGDPNAALGFFARAEQVDARSGRAKAGLGTALVMLERPDDALRLFGQAVALGISESEIARDRGLAYDLRGDARRAQRDYALALKRGPDDETTRRYALSLGISGDRVPAIVMLDPLIRKKDQSAWRARAFVLAMTGDVSGANGITRAVMPTNLAQTMVPFLARLPQLNAADKAHAVNFGTMPSTGTSLAAVEIGDPFKPVGGSAGGVDSGLIPAGDPFGPRPSDVVARTVEPVSRAPRRRPGGEAVAAVTSPAPVYPPAAAPGFTVTPTAPPAPLVRPAEDRLTGRVGGRVALVDRTKLPPEMRGEVPPGTVIARTTLPQPANVTTDTPRTLIVPPAPAPKPIVESVAPRVEVAPVRTPVPAPAPTVIGAAVVPPASPPTSLVVTPPPTPTPVPAPIPAPAPAPTVATASTTSLIGPPTADAPPVVTPPAPVVTPPTTVMTPPPAPIVTSPAPTAVTPPVSRLASILDGIEREPEPTVVALPTASEIRAAQKLAQRRSAEAAAAAAAEKAAKDAKLAEAEAARRNPPRLWVQVATGSNTRGLPTTWARIRDDNATALKGRSAYSVPFKATNRLLVGPMKSPADARALVTALAKGGVSAMTFSSEGGQEVERVSAK